MPGAFEGETVSRRRFMDLTVNAAGAATVAAIALPALGFALGPVFSRVPFDWQPIGVPSDFPDNTYVVKVITIVPGIGQAGKSIAYVRSRNPAIDTEPEDQYNHFVALSSRCMHLGCPVRFVWPQPNASSARATVGFTTFEGWSWAAHLCGHWIGSIRG